MCSPACAAGHFKGDETAQIVWGPTVRIAEWSPSVPEPETKVVLTIQGLTSWPWWPQVCSGTGWQPKGVQGNTYWTPGKYQCGICGQDIDVDAMGRLVLHAYIPKAA